MITHLTNKVDSFFLSRIIFLLVVLLLISQFFTFLVNPVKPQDSGLIGYWRFDEESGLIAEDSSGNGKDGTLNGPVWTNGKFGNALQFDGVNDNVNLPCLFSATPSALTVMAWVNSPLLEEGQIFYNGILGEFVLHTGGQNIDSRTVGFGVKIEGIWYVAYSPSYLIPNNWHHLTGVWSRGHNVRLYIDGLLASEVVDTPDSPLFDWSYNTSIGSYGGGRRLHFQGIIDECRIYDREFNENEILSLVTEYSPEPELTPELTPSEPETPSETEEQKSEPEIQPEQTSDISIVEVKPGDWIEYQAIFTGNISPESSYSWEKCEIIDVNGVDVTFNVTRDNGENGIWTENIDSDFWSGTLIPAHSSLNDKIEIHSDEIRITRIETRNYVGSERSVLYGILYGTLSGPDDQYYEEFWWDRNTGIMVEHSFNADDATFNVKAVKTNIWKAQIFGTDRDFFLIIVVILIVILAIGGLLIIRKTRKSKQL